MAEEEIIEITEIEDEYYIVDFIFRRVLVNGTIWEENMRDLRFLVMITLHLSELEISKFTNLHFGYLFKKDLNLQFINFPNVSFLKNHEYSKSDIQILRNLLP